jgi:hypothetical protein
MYGLVNKAVEQMVCTHHGQATWEAIRTLAGIDDAVFVSLNQYPDDITYRLVDAASATLGASHADILRAFGRYWTLYTAKEGYGDLIRMSGPTLFEALHNLDNMHARVSLTYAHLQPPSFACSDETDTTLLCHYYSHRAGLAPMVIGLLEGLAEMYSTPATVEQVARRDQGADHDVFRVTLVPQPA